MSKIRISRVLWPFLVALLGVPLCACPQLGGHAAGKSDATASTAAAKPAAASTTVLITTLAVVPGHTIAATEGFDCRFFLWDGSGNYVDRFEGALHAFRIEAAKHGADAVVNLRVSAIPVARQESTGRGSVVNLCGDEVKFR